MQNETETAAQLEQLQLAFVLAMGGHEYDLYNYGNGGSLNGLAAVWDSWVENFFTHVNSTSLVLLLDERDFNKQNHTKNKEKYVDILLRDNLGAIPVEVHAPNKKDHVHMSLTTETCIGAESLCVDCLVRECPHISLCSLCDFAC